MGKQKTNQADKNWRYFKTGCLSAAFFVLGVCIALIGPTLPTLASNLHTTVDNLSFIVTSRGCGYLVGSLLCTYLFRFANHHFVIACCLILTGVGNIFIPLVGHYVLLGGVVAVAGMSMGILDTGGNVMCLALWGSGAESWLQMLHFSFAFGATLAPLLATPFIEEVENDVLVTISPNISSTPAPNQETSSFEDGGFPTVGWAFTIAACSSIAVALSFCYLSFSKENKTESKQEDTSAMEGKAYRVKVLGLMFFFYLFYVGAEVAFGLFIYYFAINCKKHYSKDTGTLLNSLFWGVFAAGRFFAIFFARCMIPRTMLILDLIGTTVSTLLMVLFPFYSDEMDWLLWVAVALYGWSMASLFPTGITWAEQYITVTGSAATSFVVGAALGEMIIPFAMSYLIVQNPMNLMYYSHISNWLCIFIFVCLMIITSRKGSRLKMQSESKIQMSKVQKYDAVPTSDAEANSVEEGE